MLPIPVPVKLSMPLLVMVSPAVMLYVPGLNVSVPLSVIVLVRLSTEPEAKLSVALEFTVTACRLAVPEIAVLLLALIVKGKMVPAVQDIYWAPVRPWLLWLCRPLN